MKKYVKSSVDANIAEDHLADLISEADRCGYNMNISLSDNNLAVQLSSNGKLQFLPNISVDVEKDTTDEGYDCYYFKPSAVFPELNYSDMEYADSFEYWVDKWKDVSKFLTYMMKYMYCPDYYEE